MKMHIRTVEEFKLALEKSVSSNPYRILALSFAFVMLMGSLILYLPISSAEGVHTTYVNALFTAVSCVAVTGLTVVDTYHHWSVFGKVVMTILIQIGGLGIMTFTTLVAMVLGRRIGLKDRLTLQQAIGERGMRGLVKMALRIVQATFLLEAMGALIYAIELQPYVGWKACIPYGISQAVSSFCNAGFIFFDSTLPYRMESNVLFNINTCILIILGGIGFMVIFDVLTNGHRGFIYLTLHSKIMLVGTFFLIAVPFLLILLNEWTNPNTLGPMNIPDKLQGALFNAVTTRTAGIATLDYGEMHANTMFMTIILMFIGAGPGSCAGGVKVTTVVLIFMASIAFFKGRQEVHIYERKIPADLIYRSMTIILSGFCIVLIGTFLLSSIEIFDFIRILFEVTSAFGTVGLSTGITPDLHDSSKWILIVIMFFGRVGVLTLVGSLALRNKGRQHISYPEGRVIV